MLKDEELDAIPSIYKTTPQEIRDFAEARRRAMDAFDAEFLAVRN